MSRKKTFEERVQQTDTCYLWIGALTGGYGTLRLPGTGKYVKAHRYAWELEKGPISPTLDLHHLCHVKNCVRVDHLQPMTRSQHLREHRKICPNGHLIADPNVFYVKCPTRVLRKCRICACARQRAYNKRKRDGKQALLLNP